MNTGPIRNNISLQCSHKMQIRRSECHDNWLRSTRDVRTDIRQRRSKFNAKLLMKIGGELAFLIIAASRGYWRWTFEDVIKSSTRQVLTDSRLLKWNWNFLFKAESNLSFYASNTYLRKLRRFKMLRNDLTRILQRAECVCEPNFILFHFMWRLAHQCKRKLEHAKCQRSLQVRNFTFHGCGCGLWTLFSFQSISGWKT